MTDHFEDIIYEKQNGIARVTINRPDVLNAFRGQTTAEMTAAFKDAANDPSIGVCVLTGAGDKAFCAGADVTGMARGGDVGGRRGGQWRVGGLMELSTVMRNMPKPVIAAVKGWCVGGGNELNLFCDLTLAADNARFAQVGPRVGMCPVWGGTQLLPRIVGEKKAREMIFLCRNYEAREAERMGLVNKVVPLAELDREVAAWCQELLDKSPQSIAIAKLSLNFESDLLYPSLLQGQAMLSYITGSEEQQEGARAFMERRPPNWRQFRG